MQPHALETQELERQVDLARPVAAILALGELLASLPDAPPPVMRFMLLLAAAYLAAGVAAVLLERTPRWSRLRLPLMLDLAALAALVGLAPSVAAFWFVFAFVCYAAGVHWEERRVRWLVAAGTAALLARLTLLPGAERPAAYTLVALLAATAVAGTGFGALGRWRRRHAAEHESLARLSSLLRVELGLAESLRRMFEELVRAFGCEHALLVFRDAELDRLFVWRAGRGERGRIAPEIHPLDRSDSYLLDDLETSLCWNSFENAGEGFGWNHYDGRRVPEPPRLPGPSRKALEARSLLSVVLEFSEEPVGRVLLLNGAGPFTRHDLRWLERIFRHLGPALENLFLLRHLRARAIEAERGRVSRDLHDGILQTILGVDMQLDVLLRQVERDPASAAKDLAALRQTLRHEGEELRRMVTDLRPLRVQSADLLDLMRGFAERYRNEAGVALDLLIESADLRVPDRVCRELFQIYREALHNIKKHARASHVVVKVWQDEAYLHLMVDDNGQGFSFAGRFSSDELDRLRLGPITIKERTRGIGGVLTVESNPGHGARLTIEVPLS